MIFEVRDRGIRTQGMLIATCFREHKFTSQNNVFIYRIDRAVAKLEEADSGDYRQEGKESILSQLHGRRVMFASDGHLCLP